MHPVVYYTIGFAIAGALGMAAASRNSTREMRKQRWLKYFMYILITGTVIASMFNHFFDWVSALIILLSLAELIKVNLGNASENLFRTLFSIFFFLIIGTGFFLFGHNFDPSFTVFIYFQVLVFDGFCQVTGQLWGKHQLAPWISPTKTVEGLIGGWLCGMIAAFLARSWIGATIPATILFGLITGFAATVGDLLASYYKRLTGVKDYSNWLPGQGGFLDRFDSFVMTGFVYYFLYFLFFKLGGIIEQGV